MQSTDSFGVFPVVYLIFTIYQEGFFFAMLQS